MNEPGKVVVLLLTFVGLCQTATAQVGGTFVPTVDMTTARWGHTATLLPDGRVLIAGGDSPTAELYDPERGTFAATGRMTATRQGHTATLLPDGKVLLAGGSGLSSAELYDPSTRRFSATGSMIDDQFGQAATLLSNGMVLIVGGERSAPPYPTAARAELYDPTSGTFSLAGSYAGGGTLYPAGGPVWPTANTLPDGRVLIVGENPPELYDPTTAIFALAGRMMGAAYRYGMDWQTSTSLKDGTVLITGGNDDWTCGGFVNAEVYDPAAGTFSVVGNMTTPRDIHTATLLRDGTVLIAGGGEGWCYSSTRDSAELYEPVSQSFVETGKMTHSRSSHTATLLNDGTVLIAGGISYWPATKLRSAELYRPAFNGPRRRSVRP